MLTFSSRSSTSDSWLFYNLIAIVIFLPLPFGSQRTWAWSIVEVWTFALSAYWLILFFKHRVRPPNYWKRCLLPTICMACFAMVTLLQLAPINAAGSASIDIINEMEWKSSSLDTHATLAQLLKTLCYMCLSALVILLVNSRKRLKTLLQVFFFCGLFQATYGSVMTMTNIEHIFFFPKESYIGMATGSFINRNHFANYLIMCIACSTALLLLDMSKKRNSSWKETLIRLLNFIMSKKMLLRIGIVITVVGIVLSRSRMGNISFFISLAGAGFLWMILTKRVTRNAILLIASFIIIDLLVVGNWFGFEKVAERLQNTSTASETRDEVVRDTLIYISDHPLLGTGGGSYYATYPNYKQQDVNGYYSHTHNDYLQFLSEYGFIGTFFIALFALSAAAMAITTLIKRNNSLAQATSFAVLMVIIALLLHSLVDFSLQIMANASSAVIILSLAWVARYLPTSPRTKRRRRRRSKTTHQREGVTRQASLN